MHTASRLHSALARDFKELTGHLLPSLCFHATHDRGEFTYKHGIPPTAWSLGFRDQSIRMVSLSEKTSRRPMLLLLPSVWNFSYSCIRLPGRPCVRERGVAGWIPSLQKLQGHESELCSSVLDQDPPWGPQSQARGWMREPVRSLLGWHPCDPDGIGTVTLLFRANPGSMVSWVC